MGSRRQELWKIAFENLPLEDRAELQSNHANKLTVLENILTAVQEKRQQCLSKRWKFRRHGKEIIIRDLVDKVAHWIGKFVQVCDVAMQYDTAHTSLPWAAIRFLLQITVKDADVFGSMMEGVEIVSRLISRFATFEAVYLPPHLSAFSTAQEQLSDDLVSLYEAVLSYLSAACRYYGASTGERFRYSFVKDPDVAFEMISSRELQVEKSASTVHAEFISRLENRLLLLGQESTTNAKHLEQLIQVFEKPLIRISAPLQAWQDRLKSDERRELLRWTSTIRYRAHHEANMRDTISGTGMWFLQKPEFLKWYNSSCSSLLILHGIPGAGKTRLVSTVVQKFLDDIAQVQDAAPLAYFYCSANKTEVSRASPTEIMRAIVKQLSCSGPVKPIKAPLLAEYQKKTEEAGIDGLEPELLSFDDCLHIVLALTTDSPATIVIDGLDEVNEDRGRRLRSIHSLIEDSPSLLKVLISSREDVSYRNRYIRQDHYVMITPEENQYDIDVFVNKRVSTAIERGELLGGKVSQDLRDHITVSLIEGAGGMFLWASLHLQHLCNQQIFKLEGDVRLALKTLPPTLDDAYTNVFRRVELYEKHAKASTLSILSLMMAAQNAITVQDMISALGAITYEAKQENEVVSDSISATPLTRRQSPKLSEYNILDLCSGFISIDQHSKILSFVHHSVFEYLSRRSEFSRSKVNALAARMCLSYCLQQSSIARLLA